MRFIIITCCLLLTVQIWGASADADSSVDWSATVAEHVQADAARADKIAALQVFVRDTIAEKPTDYG